MLVKLVVLLVGDLVARPGPQGGGVINLLAGDLDRVGHEVGVLADYPLQGLGVEELLAVGTDVNFDLRAALCLVGFGQRIGPVAGRFPHHRLGVRVGRTRGQHDPIGDHKDRIETHPELPDQLDFLLLVVGIGHLLGEFSRTRAGDGADILVDLVARHADAAVADRQHLVAAGHLNLDLQLGVEIENIFVRQRATMDLVQRVRSIGDQFAQENLLLRV